MRVCQRSSLLRSQTNPNQPTALCGCPPPTHRTLSTQLIRERGPQTPVSSKAEAAIAAGQPASGPHNCPRQQPQQGRTEQQLLICKKLSLELNEGRRSSRSSLCDMRGTNDPAARSSSRSRPRPSRALPGGRSGMKRSLPTARSDTTRPRAARQARTQRLTMKFLVQDHL